VFKTSNNLKLYLISALILIILLCLTLLIFDYIALAKARNNFIEAKTLVLTIQDDNNSFSGSNQVKKDLILLNKALKLSSYAEAKLNGSLALKISSYIPLISQQLSGITTLGSATYNTLVITDQLANKINKVGLSLKFSNSRIPISKLVTINKLLMQAETSLTQVRTPSGHYFSPIQNQINKFMNLFTSLHTTIDSSHQAITQFINFATGQKPKQYLLVGLNNDEMRDEGAPLSYSILTIMPDGSFSVSQSQDIGVLSVSHPVNVSLPLGTQAVFGELDPTQLWQSTNATANFPLSAQLMLALYKQKTGQQLDGVIAIDVNVLQSLVKFLGSVTVPGIFTPLTSENIGNVLLYQLYQQTPYGQQSLRHDEIAATLKAVVNQLTSISKIDLISFAKSLYDQAQGRHLLIYSTNKEIENYLKTKGFSGSVDYQLPKSTFHLAIENATATKMDWYISISATYLVTIIKSKAVIVTCKTTITNNAPKNIKPSYLAGPDFINSFSPGEYVGRAEFWGPYGSEQLSSVEESGLRLNEIPFKIYPQESVTLTQQTILPYAAKHDIVVLHFVPQPRFNPIELSVILNAPDFKITNGPLRFSGPWVKPITITYNLKPRK
jgi:hypothetical protein